MNESITLESLFGLSGQTALVVGAAEGMGREVARYLAAAGARVAAADIQTALVEEAAQDIRRTGGDATAYGVDVGDEASIVSLVEQVRFNLGAIDILVHVAGIQDRELLADTSVEMWDRVHRVNLRGPFLMVREVSRVMREAGRPGRIVAVSSIGALHPIFEGLIPYNSSKAGLNGLVRNAAHELAAHGIRVNAVLPGNTTTAGQGRTPGPPVDRAKLRHLTPPLGRTGRVSDIAGAVLYLVSPSAEWMTGQMLVVDGGHLVA